MVPNPWGGVKRTFWGHFGPVLIRVRPFSAVLAHRTTGFGTPEGAQKALKWPKSTRNGSGDPQIRWVPRRDTPSPTGQLPTPNRELPTTINRQLPPTNNHQPPPTAINRQPPTRPDVCPKTVKSGNFQKWSPTFGEGQPEFFGPFWACLDPFSAILSRFGPFWPSFSQPGLETLMGPSWVTWAQNRSKITSFKTGPRPFGRV